jgi:hypothetical protein
MQGVIEMRDQILTTSYWLHVHWRPLIWKHQPNLVYWIFLIFDSVSVMS